MDEPPINIRLNDINHHKLPISRNFNKMSAKIIKQYVHAKFMGFKV
jgi:hypothetical protein